MVQRLGPKEPTRRTNKKTAAQGTHWHLVVSGVAVRSFIGPCGTIALGGAAFAFTNTKFVPVLPSAKKASHINILQRVAAIAEIAPKASLCPTPLHHAEILCSAAYGDD